MATPSGTAKLWWDGSAWVTTEDKNWGYVSTSASGVYAYIYATFYAIAYDNNGTYSVWQKLDILARPDTADASGTRYLVESTNTTINASKEVATLEMSNARHGSVYAQVSSVTNYVGWYGTGRVTCKLGSNAGQPWEAGNGITKLSSPYITVTYNANGGSGAPSAETRLMKVAKNISSTQPTRTGYTFSKWNTKSDGSGTNYNAGASATFNSSTTLYAIWTKNNYNVSISAGEGTTITFDGSTYTNQTTTVSKAYGKSCSYSISANTGYVLATYSPGLSGTITIPANNNTSLSATAKRVGCRVYNGSAWKQAMIYVYNGSQWKMCQAYVYNGSQWKLLN